MIVSFIQVKKPRLFRIWGDLHVINEKIRDRKRVSDSQSLTLH